MGDRYNLVIPNREIRNIITNHILKMFKESIKEDGKTVGEFCEALLKQNPEKVESIFTDYMRKTVSIRDTFVKKPTKENFYHGLLLWNSRFQRKLVCNVKQGIRRWIQ